LIDYDILIILDRSGSMNDAKADHIGGLRSFVDDQKSLGGDVRLTFVQFDSHNACEIIFDRVPLAEVHSSNINLIPRGDTPLFEAIGRSLSHLEEKQRSEKSEATVVMVVTDGQNNIWGEWTKERVRERIRTLEIAGWKVLFLGANIDAFAEGHSFGIPATLSANFSNHTVGSARAVYSTVSNNFAAARRMRSKGLVAGASAALKFSQEDYQNITSGAPVAFDSGTKTIAHIDTTEHFTDKE
jgi:hypothetical protein